MPPSPVTELLFSRRRFLRVAAPWALGASLGFPLLGEATGSVQPFTFVVVNDLHYRDARCDAWFGRVVASLRALRPRPAFVMLAGDLAEDGHPEQLAPLRAHFAQLPMPVRTVIGNHDYTEQGDRTAYERICGPELNYHFQHGGLEFLVLDTTQQRSVYRTRIAPATLQWVRGTLPLVPRARPVIILTHFPLGPNYLRPLNTPVLLDLLREHHLVGSFSGHWHGITERRWGEAQLSTGRCCSWWRHNHDGSEEKGYRICRVMPDANGRGFSLEHRFFPVPTEGLPGVSA